MKLGLTLILLFAAHTCSSELIKPQSSDVVGSWKVQITFNDESHHSLLFDAEDNGKASFQLDTPRSNWSEPSKPTQAKWTAGSDKRITFVGSIEFPIGNVGRQPGTLLFNGTFVRDYLISGEVAFYGMDQDPMDPKATPYKKGTFKAHRVATK